MECKLTRIMTSSSKPNYSDLTSLAAEACDLWQEHLSTIAQSPDAKATLMSMVEPQRQLFASLFADYAAMMQNARHDTTPQPRPSPHKPEGTSAFSSGAHDAAQGAESTDPASNDVTLRLAQLALRVAQLEQHIAGLEERLGQSEHPSEHHGNTRAGKTTRPSKKN